MIILVHYTHIKTLRHCPGEIVAIGYAKNRDDGRYWFNPRSNIDPEEGFGVLRWEFLVVGWVTREVCELRLVWRDI